MAYSNPDSGIFSGLEKFFNVAKPVVSAVASGFAHSYGAEREVEVVADDGKIADRNIQFL